jgi:hypothetical protein
MSRPRAVRLTSRSGRASPLRSGPSRRRGARGGCHRAGRGAGSRGAARWRRSGRGLRVELVEIEDGEVAPVLRVLLSGLGFGREEEVGDDAGGFGGVAVEGDGDEVGVADRAVLQGIAAGGLGKRPSRTRLEASAGLKAMVRATSPSSNSWCRAGPFAGKARPPRQRSGCSASSQAQTGASRSVAVAGSGAAVRMGDRPRPHGGRA